MTALRRRAAALSTLAAALLLAASADEEPQFGAVTTIPTPRGQGPRDAVLADVDGDGLDDLVVATRRGGRRSARFLHVHLRRREGAVFAPVPDATLEAYDNLVAFAVADVDPEPGAEVVLFTPGSVHAWRTRAADDRRTVRLLTTDFLYQAPDPKEVFSFPSAVADVNRDGLADLVVPEPDGYRVAIQRREKDASKFDPPSLLRVPYDDAGADAKTPAARRVEAKATRKQIRIAVQVGGAHVTADLLAVEESVPAPQLGDFDGDGRLDVLAQTPTRLHVWRQHADGTFPESPDASHELPFPADRRRRLDLSYSAQTADLDGDARADFVLFAGDQNSDALRTQVLVYRQRKGTGPLFPAEAPSQFLIIAGFAGAPRLIDVDGDGALDLVAGAMRLDALDAVAAAAKGTLDAELYVYRNRGGAFPTKAPDLRHTMTIRADGLKGAGESLLARLVPDATGDRVCDLLLRDEPTRLRLLALRAGRGGLQVVPTPLMEVPVEAGAKVVVHEPAGRAPEVLVLEDAQVRHVRFR